MGFAKSASMILVLVMGFCGLCFGAVYKVGDSQGWTNKGVDYNSWASTKNFNVGDVIQFEYNAKYHNVVRVRHREFKSCNATDPISVSDSGNDQITIGKGGHYYYICGVPGHCLDGMKVDVRVSSEEDAPTPSPATPPKSDQNSTHPPDAYPPTVAASPISPSPSPSNSNAPSLLSSKLHHVDFQLLTAMAILAFF